MKLDCQIKVKHNFKNINTIIKKLPQFANKRVEDILKNIQGYAIRLEKGHNSNGILVEMIETSTMKVKRKSLRRPY